MRTCDMTLVIPLFQIYAIFIHDVFTLFLYGVAFSGGVCVSSVCFIRLRAERSPPWEHAYIVMGGGGGYTVLFFVKVATH